MAKEVFFVRLLAVPPVILFLALALQWNIIDFLTPFLMVPLMAVLWLLVISAGIISLVLARRKSPRFYRPFWMVVVVVLCAWFFPFTSIWLKANFWLCREKREEVAQQIFSGKLVPNVAYNQSLIALPADRKYLSTGGGDVLVYSSGPTTPSTGVFFFTFRGILGHGSGYLYMNSDAPPMMPDDYKVEKVGPRWYWVQFE